MHDITKVWPFAWQSHSVCHVGRKRKINEDAVLERSDLGLWVVADGMGGHTSGDYASKFVVSALDRIPFTTDLGRYVEVVEHRLLRVNQYLIEEARSRKNKMSIGSTVVVMIAYRDLCVVVWAGDSRLYRIRQRTIAPLTTDHSQVELYVQGGVLSRDEAARHPHANIITRAVGVYDPLFLDMDVYRIENDDCYLLCSDGLCKHLNDHDILEGVLRGGNDEKKSCELLVEETLKRGGLDNVSVIAINTKVKFSETQR